MLVIYVPMMGLLLFVLVTTSERTLKESGKPRQNLWSDWMVSLKKIIQKMTAQPRKQIATIIPTPFMIYSRIKTSVYRVRIIDTTKYRDLLDAIFRMDNVETG